MQPTSLQSSVLDIVVIFVAHFHAPRSNRRSGSGNPPLPLRRSAVVLLRSRVRSVVLLVPGGEGVVVRRGRGGRGDRRRRDGERVRPRAAVPLETRPLFEQRCPSVSIGESRIGVLLHAGTKKEIIENDIGIMAHA